MTSPGGALPTIDHIFGIVDNIFDFLNKVLNSRSQKIIFRSIDKHVCTQSSLPITQSLKSGSLLISSGCRILYSAPVRNTVSPPIDLYCFRVLLSSVALLRFLNQLPDIGYGLYDKTTPKQRRQTRTVYTFSPIAVDDCAVDTDVRYVPSRVTR